MPKSLLLVATDDTIISGLGKMTASAGGATGITCGGGTIGLGAAVAATTGAQVVVLEGGAIGGVDATCGGFMAAGVAAALWLLFSSVTGAGHL